MVSSLLYVWPRGESAGVTACQTIVSGPLCNKRDLQTLSIFVFCLMTVRV